jgi:hypothetical protein
VESVLMGLVSTHRCASVSSMEMLLAAVTSFRLLGTAHDHPSCIDLRTGEF